MKPIHDEDGQATIFIAIFTATVLFGFLALAIDLQYLFHAKRMAQAAADAAVVAAAEEYGNTGNEQAAANAMAKLNGFDTTLAKNPAVVTLSTPSTGNYAGSATYVQATVSQPVPMFFLNAFSHKATVNVSARAVAAGALTSPTCVCLEGGTGMDLNMSNNARLTAKNCGITVDSNSSNAVGVSSATIDALSLGVVSTSWVNPGGITPTTKIVQGIKSQCSPKIVAPVLPPGIICYDNPINGWNAANGYTGIYTLPLATEATKSNVLCLNSLDTTQSAKVYFTSGYTYYIKGDFTTGGGTPLSGSGVNFYVGGNINIGNGATSTLSAPTVGSPPGPRDLVLRHGQHGNDSGRQFIAVLRTALCSQRCGHHEQWHWNDREYGFRCQDAHHGGGRDPAKLCYRRPWDSEHLGGQVSGVKQGAHETTRDKAIPPVDIRNTARRQGLG